MTSRVALHLTEDDDLPNVAVRDNGSKAYPDLFAAQIDEFVIYASGEQLRHIAESILYLLGKRRAAGVTS